MKIFVAILITFLLTLVGSVVLMRSLGQAPKSVINVSDKALERVTEGVIPEKAPEPTVEEKIADTIAASTPAVVTIHAAAADTDISKEALAENFVARGFVTSASGTVMTAASALVDGEEYIVRFAGVQESFLVREIDRRGEIAILITDGTPKGVAEIAQGKSEIGDPVVAFGGALETRIAANVIAAVEGEGAQTMLATNIPDALFLGTPLFSVDKSVVGITTSVNEKGSKAQFASVYAVKGDLR